MKTIKKTPSEVAVVSEHLTSEEEQQEPTEYISKKDVNDYISDQIEDHIFCALLRNFANFDIPLAQEEVKKKEPFVDCSQESKVSLSVKSSAKDSSTDVVAPPAAKSDDPRKLSRASTRASLRVVHSAKRRSRTSRTSRPLRKSENEEKQSISQDPEEEEKRHEEPYIPIKEDPYEVNFDYIYDVTGEDRTLMKSLMKCLKYDFLNGNHYEGNISFACQDGSGVYAWAEGSTYCGKFVGDVANGLGTMQWADGNRYDGSWKDGVRDGSGSLCVRASTLSHTYTGTWTGGFQAGKGTFKFSETNWYEGDFENGLFHGLGMRQYPSGCKYIGDWKDGKQHGNGVMLFQNNDMYVGEWVDGTMEGMGKYVWDTFFNPQFVYPMHNTYIGQWHKGARNGFGSLILSTGAVISTMWVNNVKHGWGRLLCTNGTTIESDPLFYNDNLVSMKKVVYKDEIISQVEDLRQDFEDERSSQNDSSKPWHVDCIFEPYKTCTSPINIPPYFMNIDFHITRLFHLDDWNQNIKVVDWCIWSLNMPPWCDVDKTDDLDKARPTPSEEGADKNISKIDMSKDAAKNGSQKVPGRDMSKGLLDRKNLSNDRSKSIKENNLNISGKPKNHCISYDVKKKFGISKMDLYRIKKFKPDTINPDIKCNSLLQVNSNGDLSSICEKDVIDRNIDKIYKFEKKWLRNTIIKHMPTLQLIYNRYATVCCKQPPTFECGLMRVLLWKLLKDINFGQSGYSIVEIDEMAVGKTDPFDFVSLSEMIHYLLIMAWELYTKKRNVNDEIPGVIAAGMDLFVTERLCPLLLKEEWYEPLFPNSEQIPIEGLYKLYQSLGPKLTIKSLVQRLTRDNSKAFDNHNISILPDPNEYFTYSLKGLNGVLPGGMIIYRASKLPDFEYIEEELRAPPKCVKSVDLDFLGTLGADTVVASVVKCFPHVTSSRGEILQQNYRICFLEFLDVLTECIDAYLLKVMKFAGNFFDDKKISTIEGCLDQMLKEVQKDSSDIDKSRRSDTLKEGSKQND